MVNAKRDYFKYNTLTTSEVSELLQIPKSRVLSMVDKDIINPLKKSTEEMLFLRAEIEEIKKDTTLNLPIHKLHSRTVMSDESSYTEKSKTYFEENFKYLSRIESIFIYFNKFDAAISGFYQVYEEEKNGDLFSIRTPHFIIRDINGQEMWLGGCNCGYSGEGPSGSKAILKKIGLPEEVIDLIPYYRTINIFINQDSDKVETISHNDVTSETNKNISREDIHANLFFSEKNNDLVLIQRPPVRPSVDPVDVLERYREFIPDPSKIVIFPTSQIAEEYGYNVDESRRFFFPFYNLIVIDSSGQELWLKTFYDKDKHISSQEKICSVLEYCGISIPEDKITDKIITLFNTSFRKVEPEPFIFERAK